MFILGFEVQIFLKNIIKILIKVPYILTLVIVFGFFIGSSIAQSEQRIAAVVNDKVISALDVRERIKLVIASSQIRPSKNFLKRLRQDVLRKLIDEQLQIQEAKKQNIAITKRNIQNSVNNLERQNRLKPGTFHHFIKTNKLPLDSIFAQIRAQIAWRKIVRRNLLPKIKVGAEEVEKIYIDLKKRKGQMEYRVSEIFLSFDQSNKEEDVKTTTQRLVNELKKGASFPNVARQFSRSASASVGGDLGWIQRSLLSKELKQIVPKMKLGKIFGPYRTNTGFQIYKTTGKRRIFVPPITEYKFNLKRIRLRLSGKNSEAKSSAQINLAKTLSNTVKSCSDMKRLGKEVGSVGNISLGEIKFGNLDKKLRNTLRHLPIGKSSIPIVSKKFVSIFMVCKKIPPKNGLPTRIQIKKTLIRGRLSVLVRQYMRDLRSTAVIELRV